MIEYNRATTIESNNKQVEYNQVIGSARDPRTGL